MTDEFLTGGLRNDRYLKALRLPDQFEEDIFAKLRNVGRQIIDQHPDLFEPNPDGDDNYRRSSSHTLAFARTEYPMTGEKAPNSGDTRILNVHLYWVSPAEYDRTDIDGALRAFGYKIKNCPEDVDDRIASKTRSWQPDSEDVSRRIAEQTRDWPLRATENAFGGSTDFYRHVSSAEEIDQTAEVLAAHFAEFGDRYVIS
ncbi:hypothetical protein [Halopenitus persicus]|uniref:Uncharacterized protein n=1 Tax=Halopenitus persicus TaxID=1048396 RepID=A0A1H3ILS1_9EURY|nr:hypothetical protein [Halopenitus persicus]SDY28229.1 hypothetical protein SAMN05216564_104164 [Halopenitus persicus]